MRWRITGSDATLWLAMLLLFQTISRGLQISNDKVGQGRTAWCAEGQCSGCAATAPPMCSEIASLYPRGDLCGCCQSCVLIRELGESCGSQLSVRPVDVLSAEVGLASRSDVTILATTWCKRGLVCVDAMCHDLGANIEPAVISQEDERVTSLDNVQSNGVHEETHLIEEYVPTPLRLKIAGYLQPKKDLRVAFGRNMEPNWNGKLPSEFYRESIIAWEPLMVSGVQVPSDDGFVFGDVDEEPYTRTSPRDFYYMDESADEEASSVDKIKRDVNPPNGPIESDNGQRNASEPLSLDWDTRSLNAAARDDTDYYYYLTYPRQGKEDDSYEDDYLEENTTTKTKSTPAAQTKSSDDLGKSRSGKTVRNGLDMEELRKLSPDKGIEYPSIRFNFKLLKKIDASGGLMTRMDERTSNTISKDSLDGTTKEYMRSNLNPSRTDKYVPGDHSTEHTTDQVTKESTDELTSSTGVQEQMGHHHVHVDFNGGHQMQEETEGKPDDKTVTELSDEEVIFANKIDHETKKHHVHSEHVSLESKKPESIRKIVEALKKEATSPIANLEEHHSRFDHRHDRRYPHQGEQNVMEESTTTGTVLPNTITAPRPIVLTTQMPEEKLEEATTKRKVRYHIISTNIPEVTKSKSANCHSRIGEIQTIYPANDHLGSFVSVVLGNKEFQLVYSYDMLNELNLLLRSVDKLNPTYHITEENADLLFALFKTSFQASDRAKKFKASTRFSQSPIPQLLAQNYSIVRETYYKIQPFPPAAEAVHPSLKEEDVSMNNTVSTTTNEITTTMSPSTKLISLQQNNLLPTTFSDNPTLGHSTKRSPHMAALSVLRNFMLPNTIRTLRSRLQNRLNRDKRDVEEEESEDEYGVEEAESKFDKPKNIQDILNRDASGHKEYRDEVPYDVLNKSADGGLDRPPTADNLNASIESTESPQEVLPNGFSPEDTGDMRSQKQEQEDTRLRDEQILPDHEGVESAMNVHITGIPKRIKTLVDMEDEGEDMEKRDDNYGEYSDEMEILFLDKNGTNVTIGKSAKSLKKNMEKTSEDKTLNKTSSRLSERRPGIIMRKLTSSTIKPILNNAMESRVVNTATTKTSDNTKKQDIYVNNTLTEFREQIIRMESRVDGLENKLEEVAKCETEIEHINSRIELLARTTEAPTSVAPIAETEEGERLKSWNRVTKRRNENTADEVDYPVKHWEVKVLNPYERNEMNAQLVLASQIESVQYPENTTELVLETRIEEEEEAAAGSKEILSGNRSGYRRRTNGSWNLGSTDNRTKRRRQNVDSIEEDTLRQEGKRPRGLGRKQGHNSMKEMIEEVTQRSIEDVQQQTGRRRAGRRRGQRRRLIEETIDPDWATNVQEQQPGLFVPQPANLPRFAALPEESRLDRRDRRRGRQRQRLSPREPILEAMMDPPMHHPVQRSVWSLSPLWSRPLERSKRKSKETSQQNRSNRDNTSHVSDLSQATKVVETQIPKPKPQPLERSGPTFTSKDQSSADKSIVTSRSSTSPLQKLRTFIPDQTTMSSSRRNTIITKKGRDKSHPASEVPGSTTEWTSMDNAPPWRMFVAGTVIPGAGLSGRIVLSPETLMVPMEHLRETDAGESRLDETWDPILPRYLDYVQGQRYTDVDPRHGVNPLWDFESRSAHDFRVNGPPPSVMKRPLHPRHLGEPVHSDFIPYRSRIPEDDYRRIQMRQDYVSRPTLSHVIIPLPPPFRLQDSRRSNFGEVYRSPEAASFSSPMVEDEPVPRTNLAPSNHKHYLGYIPGSVLQAPLVPYQSNTETRVNGKQTIYEQNYVPSDALTSQPILNYKSSLSRSEYDPSIQQLRHQQDPSPEKRQRLRRRKNFARKNDPVRAKRTLQPLDWLRAVQEYHEKLEEIRKAALTTWLSSKARTDNGTAIRLFTSAIAPEDREATVQGEEKPEKQTDGRELPMNQLLFKNSGLVANESLSMETSERFDRLMDLARSSEKTNRESEAVPYTITKYGNSTIQIEEISDSFNDETKAEVILSTTPRIFVDKTPVIEASYPVFKLSTEDEDFDHMYESVEVEDGDFDYTNRNSTDFVRYDEIEYIDSSNVEVMTTAPSLDYEMIGIRQRRHNVDVDSYERDLGKSQMDLSALIEDLDYPNAEESVDLPILSDKNHLSNSKMTISFEASDDPIRINLGLSSSGRNQASRHFDGKTFTEPLSISRNPQKNKAVFNFPLELFDDEETRETRRYPRKWMCDENKFAKVISDEPSSRVVDEDRLETTNGAFEKVRQSASREEASNCQDDATPSIKKHAEMKTEDTDAEMGYSITATVPSEFEVTRTMNDYEMLQEEILDRRESEALHLDLGNPFKPLIINDKHSEVISSPQWKEDEESTPNDISEADDPEGTLLGENIVKDSKDAASDLKYLSMPYRPELDGKYILVKRETPFILFPLRGKLGRQALAWPSKWKGYHKDMEKQRESTTPCEARKVKPSTILPTRATRTLSTSTHRTTDSFNARLRNMEGVTRRVHGLEHRLRKNRRKHVWR